VHVSGDHPPDRHETGTWCHGHDPPSREQDIDYVSEHRAGFAHQQAAVGIEREQTIEAIGVNSEFTANGGVTIRAAIPSRDCLHGGVGRANQGLLVDRMHGRAGSGGIAPPARETF
jgi:hypothetical protein